MPVRRSRGALAATAATLALTMTPAALAAVPPAQSPATVDATLDAAAYEGLIAGRYVVLLAGDQTGDGFVASGSVRAVRELITSTGGTIVSNLARQIGVLVVKDGTGATAAALRTSTAVSEVGQDWQFRGMRGGSSAPEPSADPAEPLQWDMQQIRTEQAHQVQAGRRVVDVGILDSGIDGRHVEFLLDGGGSNVDCARGRDFVGVGGPGVGNPDPCTDNQFHGTHVAGTVAAQANGVGIVGVAPNVTLVPVKVCDTSGYCYVSSVVKGITYAGDIELDVINMSFYVDDNEFQESTEFKCTSDPTQRAFRQAVERAVQYARGQGVLPVAALGNSDQDLAHPVDDNGQPVSNECEVVPAETQGVVGVSSLGRQSEKARYSNYGTGPNDVSAPGGNGTTGDCRRTILSTGPANTYICIQGTSMASPHAAGVAALIESQFGRLGSDGDIKLSPTFVESKLQATTIDIGLKGYDECFGNGRIDALRAVTDRTGRVYDGSAPFCPEYQE